MRLLCLIAGLSALAHAQAAPEAPITTFGVTVVDPFGLKGEIYLLPQFATSLPKFAKLKPVGTIYTSALNIPPRDFEEGFPGITKRFEWFAIDYTGNFWIENPGKYQFALSSDDGSRLYIDGHQVIDNDGIHAMLTQYGAATLKGGVHQIRISYFQGPRNHLGLILEVAPPKEGWRVFSTNQFRPPRNPDDWKFSTPKTAAATANLAQSQTEFEVASIKLAKVDPSITRPRVSCTGDRFVASALPLKLVIEWAYDIRTEFATPDWATSYEEPYNIEAKAARNMSQDECRLMAQHLLEARFQLKMHRENKEMPVFFLAVARGGSKLHELPPDGMPGKGIWLQGHNIPKKGWEMWMLASWLGGLPIVGRPVIDSTGYKGLYEFSLDYSSGAPGDQRPDIFTAVQEQLGLRLEQGIAPVETVLIDRLMKPSGN